MSIFIIGGLVSINPGILGFNIRMDQMSHSLDSNNCNLLSKLQLKSQSI